MATLKNSDQLKWQAEDDAYTMAKYQEIVGDKARMKRAIVAANKQAQDLTRRANAMRSAANTKANGGRISAKKK